MITQEVRSYEVSIWTLQDEFITVLKWSDVESRGRIQDPKMSLKNDGTEEFTFKIPMYIWERDKLIENPNWYNTRNGNIAVGLRKIKVIFNKGEADEGIFDFIIDKVEEEHSDDILMCSLTCTGLAFNELGKVGYTISLSQADFELDYEDWETSGTWKKYDGTEVTEQPLQTVQYWCDKIGLKEYTSGEQQNPTEWYFKIEMDHSSFLDGFHRSPNKVYEEAFATAWTTNLQPVGIEYAREKARAIDVSESNLYNITQTIAEQFGIFCRYDYGYDENYHIISRTVVFYNNFIKEQDGMISLTYPYSSNRMVRSLDSTDIVTKLYVRSIENDTTLLGEDSIVYTKANKTGENYILDFDYLHSIKTITDEQYEEVEKYEQAIKEINETLIPLENKLAAYNIQKPELEGKLVVYTNAIPYDKGQIEANSALYEELHRKYGDENDPDNYLPIKEDRPAYGPILQDADGNYYLSLNTEKKGIVTDTIKIYRKFINGTCSEELTGWKIEPDEFGNALRIYGIAPTETSNHVYLTYKYMPQLYYTGIIATWKEKLAKDEQLKQELEEQLGTIDEETGEGSGLLKQIYDIEQLKKQKLLEKKQLIADFNHMMGPALREGFWQPEGYTNFGTKMSNTKTLSATYQANALIADTGDDFSIGWDNILFDNEQDIYYKESINQTKVYYPCINLSSIYDQIKENIEKYSFIFNNNYYNPDANTASIANIRNFTVGPEAIVSYVSDGSTVYPALILIGAKSMTDEQLAFMKDTSKGKPRIGILTPAVNNGQVNTTITSVITLTDNDWLFGERTIDQCEAVMPRIKFSNLQLRTDAELYIKFNDKELQQFYDYYINTRNTERDNNYYPEYLITLKPQSLATTNTNYIGSIKVNYALSTAATSIYLDALKISKENSKPKVSYSIDVNILNRQQIRYLYQYLNQIVMLNDAMLKFENVFGYISSLDLDLDNPSNDSIEVKNYTTKFEDIFSTIVAQTEDMKRLGDRLGSAAYGMTPLTSDSFSETLTQHQDILTAYLDSYFDSSEVVNNKLTELFTEAGQILTSGNKSLENVNNLTMNNASILAGFTQNITSELTPTVFTQHTEPTGFKVGDIWEKTKSEIDNTIIGYYVATADYTNSSPGSGFTRTYDGTLASIKGASLNIDTVEGKVEILAQNTINMKSGGNIYIAANENVEIVGNKAVNIGGTQINLCSLYKKTINEDGSLTATNELVETTGINLIAGEYRADGNYSNSTSRILISPHKIEMGSANIYMRGSNVIQMITSRNTTSSTSAIEISPDTGVWIGSGQGVRLFSGGFSYNASTNSLTKTAATGASVELNAEHLILGYANTQSNSATAIEMNEKFVIIAAGDQITGNTTTDDGKSITGTTEGLVGAKFTKDSIGMAVTTDGVITAMLMDKNGFTVGSGGVNVTLPTGTGASGETNTLRASNGSYTRINKDGIELGSLADIYINANNFKLQTNSRSGNNPNYVAGNTIFAFGNNLQNINSGNLTTQTPAQLAALDADTTNNIDIRLVLNQYGLYAKGNITATSFTAPGLTSTQKFYANSTKFGFYDGNTSLLTLDSTGAITAGGDLTITSGKNFTVTSSNFKVNPTASNGADYFYVGDSGDSPSSYIKYVSAQTVNNETIAAHLEVKGDITATGFHLAQGVKIAGSDIDTSTGSFGVSGLSFEEDWADSGNDYVTLTSNVGLLLGADNGIIIPSSSSSISNPYLLINEDGIELNGKHIKINGQQEWSRDDIIVLTASSTTNKPPWLKNRKAIETYMQTGEVRVDSSGNITDDGELYTRPEGATTNDWVLIKPYYNNRLVFTSATSNGFTTFNTPAVFSMASSVEEPYFADDSGWFKFKITFQCYMNVGNNNTSVVPEQRYISIRLVASHPTLPNRIVAFDNTASQLQNIQPRGEAFSQQFLTGTLRGITLPTTISLTMENLTGANYNVCGEQFNLSLEITDVVGSNQNGAIGITNVEVIASNDSTSTCVPCTVFYYP